MNDETKKTEEQAPVKQQTVEEWIAEGNVPTQCPPLELNRTRKPYGTDRSLYNMLIG